MNEFYKYDNGLYDLPEQAIGRLRNHILFSNLFITSIGYYSSITGLSFESFKTDRHFLIYCINGIGQAIVDGVKYRLSSLQYLMIPAESLFSLYPDRKDPWEVYIVLLKGLAADVVAHELIKRMRLGHNYVNPDLKMANRFKELYITLQNISESEDFIHLYVSLNNFLEPFIYAKKATGKGEADVVNQTLEFLKDNINKNLSVADISAYANLSVSKFSVLFKTRMGYSPIEYFNLLKIQKACQLLSSTDLRINEVGREVGFNDAYYFSRLFRSALNQSPKEYRRQNTQLV
jgi:AraC family transcriptional regulator of arabinose operon